MLMCELVCIIREIHYRIVPLAPAAHLPIYRPHYVFPELRPTMIIDKFRYLLFYISLVR